MSAKVHSTKTKLISVKSEPIVLEATPVKSLSSTANINNNHNNNYNQPSKKMNMNSHSAHTTPIANDLSDHQSYGTMQNDEEEEIIANTTTGSNRSSLNVRALGIGLSISVDNIPPQEIKATSQSQPTNPLSGGGRSSRHSKKYKDINKESNKGAGHTPPPSTTISGHARFSDLVRDTDKKEGPINWWNLKVKMPDDNTMNILSPHRIPVPQTPTTPGNLSPTPKKNTFTAHRLSIGHLDDEDNNNTPSSYPSIINCDYNHIHIPSDINMNNNINNTEYIMKTPDGLRISLLDVDIDDEKQMSELGISVDEAKKEYIYNLKKEV